MSEITNKSKELKDSISQLSETPYPAWLLGASLLYQGILTTKPVSADTGSGGSFKFSQSLAYSKPTRASCFTFGLTHLLGGWIIFDGDVSNGSGFSFAWSTLYLIVNGRSSVRSLVRGRISPLGLSILALGNAGLYGKKFFWP